MQDMDLCTPYGGLCATELFWMSACPGPTLLCRLTTTGADFIVHVCVCIVVCLLSIFLLAFVWLAPLFFDWCYSCSIFCISYILVSWNLPWNSALQSLFLLVLVEKQLLLLCNLPLGPAHPGSHLSSTTQSWPVPFFPMKLEALARKRPHSGLQSPKWLWDLKLNVRLLKPRALLDKV